MSQDRIRSIGLTGGIGSGKSSVSRLLRDFGAHVLDADALVHQLQVRGNVLWSHFFEELGWPYVDATGDLLRSKISRRLFSDHMFRRHIGDMVHPVVRQELKLSLAALKKAQIRLAVLDIPLLLESTWAKEVDEVWVVYATIEQQRQRVMDRDDLSSEEADQRIRSQMALARKIARADRVINNTGSFDHLKREVFTLWEHVGGLTAVSDEFEDS